jgi:hypothetical protein
MCLKLGDSDGWSEQYKTFAKDQKKKGEAGLELYRLRDKEVASLQLQQ